MRDAEVLVRAKFPKSFTLNYAVVHKLGLKVPLRTWNRSGTADGGLPKQRRDNGRLGWRRIPRAVLRKTFTSRSNETCRPFRGRQGRKRQGDKALADTRLVKQQRALVVGKSTMLKVRSTP